MSPKFSFKSGLLSLTLCVAAAGAVLTPAPAAQAGDEEDKDTGEKIKCDAMKHGSVKAHCSKVGGKASDVRKAMKAAQKAYKAAGKGDLKCTSCHEKGKGGPLKAESDKLWPDFEPFFKTASGG